jgi:hypothetical protein
LHYAGAVELSTYSLQLAKFSRARYLEPKIMPLPNGNCKRGSCERWLWPPRSDCFIIVTSAERKQHVSAADFVWIGIQDKNRPALKHSLPFFYSCRLTPRWYVQLSRLLLLLHMTIHTCSDCLVKRMHRFRLLDHRDFSTRTDVEQASLS